MRSGVAQTPRITQLSVWYSCREAHPEEKPGYKVPPLEKMQPPGSPLSGLWSLCLAALQATPRFPRPQGPPAEAISSFVQSPSFPPPTPSSKSLLPSFHQQSPGGRSGHRNLAFFGHSPMLTILPSFLPSRTVTCTCTCAGQTTPMCQAQYTPRTPPLASSWVQVGGSSGFYSLKGGSCLMDGNWKP